jgi:hypothetical protein
VLQSEEEEGFFAEQRVSKKSSVRGTRPESSDSPPVVFVVGLIRERGEEVEGDEEVGLLPNVDEDRGRLGAKREGPCK